MAHEWHSAYTQMFSLWKSWTEVWELCILERGKFSSVKLEISEKAKMKTVPWSVDTEDNQLSVCWYWLIQIQKCSLNWWKSIPLSHCVILVGQGVRISTVVTSPMLIHPYKLIDQPWSKPHSQATVSLTISNTASSGSGVLQFVCDFSLIEKSLYNGLDS